uniref:Uncharacterized protein n=1 Tax=Mycobacterium riyadhense TaxID=486698 RepID=A0A653F2F5_9MYCO|nr:hypothetical protein BIN_B_05261 [Mycobacterium riyadhense]
MLGQRIEESVRSRVTALTWATHHRRGGREQHKRRQAKARGQFVQMQGSIQFRPQYPLNPLAIQRFDHPIGQHPRGVDHRAQRMLSRDRGQCCGQLISVGHIHSRERDAAAQIFQFAAQLLGALGAGTAATDQQQMPAVVHGGQMARQRHTQHTRAPSDQHRAAGVKHRSS